jgi:catalase
MAAEQKSVLTTSWGAPVDDNQNSITAGPAGPILLQDTHLIDKLAHFDRERIPERVVHAKGAGAHGYFEVTADVTAFTKAKFLNKVGKRTPLFARFSTVGGEKGSHDCARDPRGFAIKHYTEEGVYDMVGNNTPIFFIRDPIKFPDFIHTQKRHPATNVPDANMVFDFCSQVPESLHQFTFLFTDRGTPYSYRHMNGYSSHTFKWVNAKDEAFWIKMHYKPTEGVKNFTREEAAKQDPDHHTRDLFNHIAAGKQAVWTVSVQIMPIAEASKYKWNVFDITKVWPKKDYPLKEYGKMVLNRNPKNYFAEVEQAAFSPGHLVPGIEPSPDRMLQGRLFSYPDTHRHRLGPNYQQIPINCPYSTKVSNHQRDGSMSVDGNSFDAPNYEPNTHAGSPVAVATAAIKKFYVDDWVARYPQLHPNSDFEQVGTFYRKVLSESDRTNLVGNLVAALSNAKKPIQARMLDLLAKADSDYSKRVAEGLAKANKSSSL